MRKLDHGQQNSWMDSQDADRRELEENFLAVPHDCIDRRCPGNVNARKLAAFPAVVEALRVVVVKLEAGWPADALRVASDGVAQAERAEKGE